MCVAGTSLDCDTTQDERVENIIFQLKPVPPFRLDLTVWALRRRPHNLVDRWDGQTYRRILLVNERPVEAAVTQIGPAEAPLLRVEASNCPPHLECVALLTTFLIKLLGLSTDLSPFYRLAAADDRLRPIVQRFRGFKPPRFPTVFEALANAIACQQLTLTLGVHLLNRLATRYGPTMPGVDEVRFAFPRPEDLADLQPEALRTLGFSRNKARALIELGRDFRHGTEDLENLKDQQDKAAMTQLLALRGIGRWSAEYVLLRGLGRWSVFPGDDVGGRRHLQTWLDLDQSLDYEGVRRHLARWHPYGGLLYFHFLLSHLAEEGYIA
jgi:DNA-3-methyladenine glycosylase II